jgi:hypothetical protein
MSRIQTNADPIPSPAFSRLLRGPAGRMPLGVIMVEHGEREALEAYIGEVFARAYGARVRHFLPRLIGLHGPGGRLVAALGMRSGAGDAFFLEQYLEAPVERLLAARSGRPVKRAEIVELGNLAAEYPGSARRLILHLAQCLHQAGFRWVVFTITPALVNSFRRLGLELTCLGPARPERLALAARADWGSYYDSGPVVCAAHIPGGLARIRELLQPAAPSVGGCQQPPERGEPGPLALAG